jgi:hypothetical protein
MDFSGSENDSRGSDAKGGAKVVIPNRKRNPNKSECRCIAQEAKHNQSIPAGDSSSDRAASASVERKEAGDPNWLTVSGANSGENNDAGNNATESKPK